MKLIDTAYLIPQDTRNALRRTFFVSRYNQTRKKLNPDQPYTYAPFVQNSAIFVHIPKTGGVSIAKAIFGCLAGGHSNVGNYQSVFTRNEYESMYKFTFIRNPWSRLYSAYNFLLAGGMAGQDPEWTGKDLARYESFSDFVVHGLAKGNVYHYVHFLPQIDFLCLPLSRSFQVNFIGLFENITSDFDHVCEKIGAHDIELPHLNRGKTATSLDYKSAYTEKSRKVVEKIYARDVKILGYDFHGKNLKTQISKRSCNVYHRHTIFN